MAALHIYNVIFLLSSAHKWCNDAFIVVSLCRPHVLLVSWIQERHVSVFLSAVEGVKKCQARFIKLTTASESGGGKEERQKMEQKKKFLKTYGRHAGGQGCQHTSAATKMAASVMSQPGCRGTRVTVTFDPCSEGMSRRPLKKQESELR